MVFGGRGLSRKKNEEKAVLTGSVNGIGMANQLIKPGPLDGSQHGSTVSLRLSYLLRRTQWCNFGWYSYRNLLIGIDSNKHYFSRPEKLQHTLVKFVDTGIFHKAG
jgi:hypothetical protein